MMLFQDTFDTSPFALLSNRELEVLHLTADGRDLVEVSNVLLISPAAVSRHRSNICRKLGTRTILEAARIVWETRYSPQVTNARFQFEHVLPTLVGAFIVSPVMREDEWFGLMMRLRNGEIWTMWIDSDPSGEQGGWVRMARRDKSQ